MLNNTGGGDMTTTSPASMMMAKNTRQTIHDVSHKLYDNMKEQQTTNRNDKSYRNWIKGKL